MTNFVSQDCRSRTSLKGTRLYQADITGSLICWKETSGSTARQDTNETNDIDILVELAPKASLFDLVRVKLELEAKLGRKIDLVEYGIVNPRIMQRTQTEQVTILWNETFKQLSRIS